MSLLRFLLFLPSVIYGGVLSLRHMFYDLGIFKSRQFPVKTICVGNLSFGGTGKTPMVEYLIRLLNDKVRVATLSRGYGRKTKGFRIVNEEDTAVEVGDEPMQYRRKFNDIVVAVDEKRARAIPRLDADIIILDDALQHRLVTSDMTILLTRYDALYTDDMLFPAGRLRDLKARACIAQTIIVTKCPSDLSEGEMKEIKNKLKPNSYQQVFFSTISYSETLYSRYSTIDLYSLQDRYFTLVSGVATSDHIVKFLEKRELDFEHLKFSDHHVFSKKELDEIYKRHIVVTTEKDYMRLPKHWRNIWYIPIETEFLRGKYLFDEWILSFVK